MSSTLKLGDVRPDTRCAVCWGTLKKVKVVSPSLHRFCGACIEEHIRKLCVPARVDRRSLARSNNQFARARVFVLSRPPRRRDPSRP
jgi:hypothetical protein